MVSVAIFEELDDSYGDTGGEAIDELLIDHICAAHLENVSIDMDRFR